MFDVEPLGKRPSPTFKAWVRTYHLGELLVAGTHFGDEQFSRSVKRISSDGLDHYQVQLYYDGGLVGETKHNQMKVRPGDIQIVDMAQQHISSAQGSSTIVLAVQRNALAEMLPDHTDPHGVILAGDRGAGALLADYIKSLYRRMDTVEVAEAPFIARATLHMLAACLQPSARTSERARMQIEGVIAERIKRYIGENVGARELSPAELCKRFRISRSQSVPDLRAARRRGQLHPGAPARSRVRPTARSIAPKPQGLRDSIQRGILQHGAFQRRLPPPVRHEPDGATGRRSGGATRSEDPRTCAVGSGLRGLAERSCAPPGIAPRRTSYNGKLSCFARGAWKAATRTTGRSLCYLRA